jgi:predicted RNA binding protein YcfA (HicA-like mRNA interferase family)
MEHNHTSSFSHEDHTLIIASDPSMPEDVNVKTPKKRCLTTTVLKLITQNSLLRRRHSRSRRFLAVLRQLGFILQRQFWLLVSWWIIFSRQPKLSMIRSTSNCEISEKKNNEYIVVAHPKKNVKDILLRLIPCMGPQTETVCKVV